MNNRESLEDRIAKLPTKEFVEKNFPNCLFAYLDVLGYKELVVQAKQNPDEIYKKVYNIKETFRSLIDTKDTQGNESLVKYAYGMIHTQIVGDSFLIACPLKPETLKALGEYVQIVLMVYFKLISFFTIQIMIELGFLARGAITKGQYYQKKLQDDDTFILSNAMVEAYLIEKEAINPRIVISDNLVEYLRKIGGEELIAEADMDRDVDGTYCLDVYNSLDGIPIFYSGMLKKLKATITSLMQGSLAKQNHRKEVSKIIWFANYHNDKIFKYKQEGKISDVVDYLVEIPRYLTADGSLHV